VCRTGEDAVTGTYAFGRSGGQLGDDLVVVDDIGLLPDPAEAFYRLIDAAYERRSLATSSNVHPAGFDELVPATLATASPVTGIVALLQGRRRLALEFVGAVLFGWLLTYAAKLSVSRPRPVSNRHAGRLRDDLPDGPGHPSRHVTVAVGLITCWHPYVPLPAVRGGRGGGARPHVCRGAPAT
jgi:hypothetical protein